MRYQKDISHKTTCNILAVGDVGLAQAESGPQPRKLRLGSNAPERPSPAQSQGKTFYGILPFS